MQGAVNGVSVNELGQCAHYHSPLDIVAIKFKCCDTFYACIRCHDKLAGHAVKTWPKTERDTKAVLCGSCQATLSIAEYLASDHCCPHCGARFNPGCATHRRFYFDL